MNWDLGGFLPHGVCFAGRPDLIWLHVASDAIIAIAYFMIPVTLVYFLRRRRGPRLSFHWALGLFAAFILLCGTGHVLDIMVIWRPWYYLEGFWKAATALVSIVTALAILPLVPRLLALRDPEELEALNRNLETANQQLAEANGQLTLEIAARKSAEADLRESLVELNRTAQELEQFAYIASHDLQAPLRNITGFAQLLDRRYRSQLDGDAIEFLDYINKGVASMQVLIQDLLQLSRVGRSDNGGFERRPLRATVDAALKPLLGTAATAPQVDIGELPEVLGDHTLLMLLFQNLFANAIKFHRQGVTPRIEVRAVDAGSEWHISVRDNGIGIPGEQLEAIFAIFRRLHTQDEFEGTGIGLAIVRKVAAHHGAVITAESAGEGQGSTFHLRLPKQPVQREMVKGVPALGTG